MGCMWPMIYAEENEYYSRFALDAIETTFTSIPVYLLYSKFIQEWMEVSPNINKLKEFKKLLFVTYYQVMRLHIKRKKNNYRHLYLATRTLSCFGGHY